MDRLTEKLNKAAGAASRSWGKIEAKADALIAREAALEQRTEQVFAPHEAILDDAEKGLDEVERKLGVMSNDPFGKSAEQPTSSPLPPSPEPVSSSPPPAPASAPLNQDAQATPQPPELSIRR